MISRVPRLAPSVIRRPRLEDWFERFRSVPVRFLVAPAGYGKTTAIVNYLRHSASRGLYCGLGLGATATDVWAGIGAAILAEGERDRIDCATHDDVIRALAACAPIELALDCDESPDADGVAAIAHIIEELPEGVALLIARRSRVGIDVGRLLSRGMASLCDAERLAFEASEVRHLAETCKVSFAQADFAKLLEASDGWPLVVSGAVRKAAEDGCDLSAALENWRSRHGHFFTEFVLAALENVPEAEAAGVRQLMAGAAFDDAQLQSLEMLGLFVIHDARGYRPLRALSRLRAQRRSAPSRSRSVTPLHVRMFGRFQAEIGHQPIEWVRRRDQQIFKFIALKRGGAVTRAELAATFWPDAEKHLVAQSLRTACSNIRKAIANIVGVEDVDSYFHANGDVAINPNNVIVDVNRFLAHANDGDQQYERRDLRAAYAHYRTADQLYGGDLLAGDAAETWSTAHAAMLEDRHAMVLERLTAIAAELSDHAAGVNYARRVTEVKPESEAARKVLAQVAATAVRPAASA
ncbi:MAG: BTAD domain-containing putative transcriptional regulator [Candidatus Tumulicola sp.]